MTAVYTVTTTGEDTMTGTAGVMTVTGTGIEIETGTDTMNAEAMTIIVKTMTDRYSLSESLRGD